jgi:integrase
VRTVPVFDWVRSELDDWLAAAAIDRGKVFRRVNKAGRTWGDGMTVKEVWHIVKESAKTIGIAKLAPHDLRRLCSALPRIGRRVRADPISFGAPFSPNDRTLPWPQTADSISVNDRIGIEPNP